MMPLNYKIISQCESFLFKKKNISKLAGEKKEYKQTQMKERK